MITTVPHARTGAGCRDMSLSEALAWNAVAAKPLTTTKQIMNNQAAFDIFAI